MIYNIEKGVPIPESKAKAKRNKNREWLEKMEIGDSVVVPKADSRSVMISAAQYARKTEKKFKSHKIDNTQARVWRIA